MDESKDVLGWFFNDGYVTGSKKYDEIVEIDQKVVKNDLWHLLLLKVKLLSINFLGLNSSFKFGFSPDRFGIRLLLFNFWGHMQYLINNLEQMISAPLLIISHNVFEYAIHFHHNVHLHELCEFDFSWLNYCADDFYGESVEFWMVYFEILENYVY